MHSWKKKLVVSQLALACTLAITSQANTANYDTWTYIDNPVTALDWDHMDKAGTVDGNYVNYSGFVYYKTPMVISISPLTAIPLTARSQPII